MTHHEELDPREKLRRLAEVFDEDPPEPPTDEEARRVCDELGVDLDALHRRILAMVDAHEAAARAPESDPRPAERPPDSAEGAAASERGEPSAQVLSIAAVRGRGARPWLAAGVAVCAVAAAAAVAAIRAAVRSSPVPAAREGLSATMSMEPASPALPDAGPSPPQRPSGEAP